MNLSGLEREFRRASNAMVQLSPALATGISPEERLALYAHYKQALLGDNLSPKPGFFDQAGNQKWWAWHSLRGMSRETAMQAYIDRTAQYRGGGAFPLN